ncbi:MAG: hypothetical protein GY707_01905 [Desulfobacteraceae bacterium]|nr:hypothetical protein [Desulfobacteraceae bacterium]
MSKSFLSIFILYFLIFFQPGSGEATFIGGETLANVETIQSEGSEIDNEVLPILTKEPKKIALPFLMLLTAQEKYNGYMGFTPWPSDLTMEALENTYRFIISSSNIISHHVDNGVPWDEALNGKLFPKHLRDDWNMRMDRTPSTHKIMLSITPMEFERTGLAPAWGEDGGGKPLPLGWEFKAFNDPEVKTAFLNYALRAIEMFNPSFLAIGIESNILISNVPEKWDNYLELNAYVYDGIKKIHPNLPVFSTVQYEHLRGIEIESMENKNLQIPGVMQLMEHSDYLALSTYQYGLLHPNPTSENYFETALSFNKPIAISETGAMSETTIISGVSFPSNEDTQNKFIEMILQNAVKHEFSFVINWVGIDFDPMISKLGSRGEIAKAWVHTGMLTYMNKAKKAYKTWMKYLQVKP